MCRITCRASYGTADPAYSRYFQQRFLVIVGSLRLYLSVICLDAVVVEPMFKILEVYSRIPADFQFGSFEVCNRCLTN